jgi:hypothetical protein
MRCCVKIVVRSLMSMVLVLGASSVSADPFVIRPDGGTTALVLDFEGDLLLFFAALEPGGYRVAS